MPRSQQESDRPKRVTMQDIADVAGVHLMTVSNALGDVRHVAPETKERVRRIARELNYVPNVLARSLAVGKTGLIAVATGRIDEPYYASLVHRLEEKAGADGYKLALLRRQSDVIDLINATGSVPVDGVIAIDMYALENEAHSQPVVPCIAIGTYDRTYFDYVRVDLSAAVEQALELMVAAGRTRIAYVVNTGYLSLPSEVRARTYLEFMARIGKPPEIINANIDQFPVVRQRLAQYLEANGHPDALLCLNDEIAMCAYRVLTDLGLKVPDDVLLVGCDGQMHMEYFNPPLSTIKQPLEEMSAAAWSFLMQRMSEPSLPLQQAVLTGDLVVTQSLRPVERN